MKQNVIIIGSGPAGISAALYTCRAGLSTTIIAKDVGSLKKAEKIQNYYGIEHPIRGDELSAIGINQARSLGATFIEEEVIGINYEDSFIVRTLQGNYPADSIIIATGTGRKSPPIPGLAALEGRGVSYCAVCDAFFYHGKDIAVLGNSDYARSEIMELLPLVNSVTLVTNGKPLTCELPEAVKVIPTPIKELVGTQQIEEVLFQDETTLPIAGIFIALDVASGTDLARKIGAQVDQRFITADENKKTNIPGLFAAGDCTGGMLQVAKAVYDGAKAGTAAIQYVRSLT